MSRQKAQIDLDKLEELAGLGMSKREICAFLGISESTFYDNQATNTAISERFQLGRSKGLADCLAIIRDAATKDRDPKMALEFAKRFGDLWKEKPELSAEEGQASQQPILSDEVRNRVAKLILEQQGYVVYEPEAIQVAAS